MKLRMNLKCDTRTCHRFEYRDDSGKLVTLYLKKDDVAAAGIAPKKGIVVTVEEAAEC